MSDVWWWDEIAARRAAAAADLEAAEAGGGGSVVSRTGSPLPASTYHAGRLAALDELVETLGPVDHPAKAVAAAAGLLARWRRRVTPEGRDAEGFSAGGIDELEAVVATWDRRTTAAG